jgi:hypothetical protein
LIEHRTIFPSPVLSQKPSADKPLLGGIPFKGALYVGRSWSFADDRRVIELAKAKTSLEEVVRITKRTPERIRKIAMRLGVKFKAEGTTTKRRERDE